MFECNVPSNTSGLVMKFSSSLCYVVTLLTDDAQMRFGVDVVVRFYDCNGPSPPLAEIVLFELSLLGFP